MLRIFSPHLGRPLVLDKLVRNVKRGSCFSCNPVVRLMAEAIEVLLRGPRLEQVGDVTGRFGGGARLGLGACMSDLARPSRPHLSGWC